jgi:hypothetical protein
MIPQFHIANSILSTQAGQEIGAPRRELSRHITADGRNSLKKHMFSGRNVVSMWANKVISTATLPLFVCIAGGATLAAWFATRHLITSPDVRINKVARKSTIRENHEDGKRWSQHHASMRGLPGNVVPEKVAIKKE